MNLTEMHWKVGAEAILNGCLGMVMSEQQACAKKLPNCPPADTSACPHNWFSFHEFCFSVWTQNLSWVEAEKVCQAVNGHLASILSEDENAFVSMLLVLRHTRAVSRSNTMPLIFDCAVLFSVF